MIYVYKLTNQNDELIYYGSTQNIEKRLKQHQAGIRAKKPKKFLYKQCKLNNWTIKIKTIMSFERRSDAKIFELFKITNEIVNNGFNTKLKNSYMDQGRIFFTNSPFGLKHNE